MSLSIFSFRNRHGTCLFIFFSSFAACCALALLARKALPLDDLQSLAVSARIPDAKEYYLGVTTTPVENYIIYHGLEGVVPWLRRADVLFLGDSLTKNAFLKKSLAPFFERAGMGYYNLGFNAENSTFSLAIIRKYDLHPKWVVVSVDPFFSDATSKLTERIIHSGYYEAWKQQLEAKMGFFVRRHLHAAIPYLAGNCFWPQFRSRVDGTTFLAAHRSRTRPGAPRVTPIDRDIIKSARDFKAEMDRRGIKIALTAVPPIEPSLARQLAGILKAEVLIPEVKDLLTLDGLHLEPESADRFSHAFLMEFRHVLEKGATGVPANG